MEDYYKVLGLSPRASQEEIRKAYLVLAKKYHPDVNQGYTSSEEYFKRVQMAYAVLSDPGKRLAYDQEQSRIKTIHPAPHRKGPSPSTNWANVFLKQQEAKQRHDVAMKEQHKLHWNASMIAFGFFFIAPIVLLLMFWLLGGLYTVLIVLLVPLVVLTIREVERFQAYRKGRKF